ncbi:MAG TPA: sugar phosphate isomerase/epimerase [Ruminiclostridium sp.]
MSKFIFSGFGDEIAPDLQKQLEVLGSLGIKALEIRRVDKVPIAQHSVESIKKIKKQLDANGAIISAMGSAIGKVSIHDDFEEHLKEFNRIMDYADILETKKIRMFSFIIPEGEDYYKHTDEVLRRLEIMLKLAVKREFILIHENEKPVYGNNAVRCEIIMRNLFCNNFKAAFDPANFVQVGQAPYPEAWELLKKYVVHMHVKDALYTNQKVTVVGEGDGEVKKVLTDLYKSNYEGFLVLEPHIADYAGHIDPSGEGSTFSDGPTGFKAAANALFTMLEEIKKENI